MPRPRNSAAAVAPPDNDALATVQMSEAAYSRLSPADMHAILYMAAEGKSQTDIARVVDCAQSTVSDFLRRVSNPSAVVQKVLKAHELKAAKAWDRAIEKAADRGDHRPARELIEMANPDLRPQPANAAGGGGVTINIGMPGSPLQLPDISIAPTQAALSPTVSNDSHKLTDDR